MDCYILICIEITLQPARNPTQMYLYLNLNYPNLINILLTYVQYPTTASFILSKCMVIFRMVTAYLYDISDNYYNWKCYEQLCFKLSRYSN